MLCLQTKKHIQCQILVREGERGLCALGVVCYERAQGQMVLLALVHTTELFKGAGEGSHMIPVQAPARLQNTSSASLRPVR